MIADLKPYPARKDSGVGWLGEAPEHWRQVPGRACFTEHKTLNVGLVEDTVLSLSYGQIVVKPPEKLHGLVPASFETYQIIESNDIVIRPTDLQNDWNSLRFGLAPVRGIITSAYMCFRTTPLLTPQYGHLLLHTYDLKKVFYGLGSGLRQNLDWRDFKYLPCAIPPLPEQAAIVRFLDHVDRRVRRYVRAKQKLIGLLEEQKQAIIHRAVTRGLDADVPLKPSGVEWLGDVPEHWEVVPLKRVAQIIDGDRGSEYPIVDDFVDEGIPFLSSKSIRTGSLTFDNTPFITREKFRKLRAGKLQSGDIVMTVRGTIGNSALFTGNVHTTGFINAQMMILRSINTLIFPAYLLQLTQSRYFNELLAFRAYGSAQQQLTNQILSDLPLPVPPREQQDSMLGLNQA